MKTEAETGVMQLQAKEKYELAGATRSWGEASKSLEREHRLADTLTSDFRPSEL